MMSSRLEELHGAERELVLKKENIIRLRMNPESKKVAENDQMRLLGMGHTEPVEWNDGKCLDSPMLMASTTKMMIAMDDGTYCDQPVVGSDSVTFIQVMLAQLMASQRSPQVISFQHS